MGLYDHAVHELDLIGLTDKDDYNGMMRKHILHMVKEFCDEGHSGFSASYALRILEKLLAYKPLSPLTGEDDEWTEVTRQNDGVPLYQNKRLSSVFKDGNGEAYDINGKVFWEWRERELDSDEEGYPGTRKFKSYYSNRECRTPVTFPYQIPDKPTYVYRESDAE